MLIVMMFCSPPYNASANASAVSVLPTPLGPTSMNTPSGRVGLASPALALATVSPIFSIACRWPTTRLPSVFGSDSTAATSSRSIRPTGMPVHPPTTSATLWGVTNGLSSGRSPCAVARSARRAANRACPAGSGVSAAVSCRPRSMIWRTRSPSCSHRCCSEACRSARVARRASSSAARAAWSMPIDRSRRTTSASAPTASISRKTAASSGGVACRPTATDAQAASSTPTALSGSCRAGIYRVGSRTAAVSVSSRMWTSWSRSSLALRPRSIFTHAASDGSSTFTTWNRRVRAGSRSKYSLYSDQVVAAIVRSLPRARAGLSRLAASP